MTCSQMSETNGATLTAEHALQRCPKCVPRAILLHTKLYGSKGWLEKTFSVAEIKKKKLKKKTTKRIVWQCFGFSEYG